MVPQLVSVLGHLAHSPPDGLLFALVSTWYVCRDGGVLEK